LVGLLAFDKDGHDRGLSASSWPAGKVLDYRGSPNARAVLGFRHSRPPEGIGSIFGGLERELPGTEFAHRCLVLWETLLPLGERLGDGGLIRNQNLFAEK
jgi:hypothetical protein